MLLVFPNNTNIEIIVFWLMHFGFTLDSSDIDLWNIGFLDTHLDLLDTYISNTHFVCLQDVLKTCHQDVLKTCLQDVLKMSSA